MKVRIIGAGFSGLAMGYALVKRGVEVEIVESSSRVGGLLTSERLEWGLVEGAANAIRASKNVVELARDIGVKLQSMKKKTKRRYIYRGEPKQLPLSALEFTRMSAGFFTRPKPKPGQSLQSYAESVFGYGGANYLIEPAMFGIFAERASELSANLIYDYFFKYRSQKSGEARGSLAPAEGMQNLAKAMAEYIERQGGKILLGQEVSKLENTITVVATNAEVAAKLLAPKDEWVAETLGKVRYISLSSVTIGYKEANRPIDGFGCLFPANEDFSSLGVLFNNDIFENRGPFSTETWMLRGSEKSDDELIASVLKDRERMTQLQIPPDQVKIHHWKKALPQYSIELERALESLVMPSGVYLAGNYLGRMGLAKILDQCHEIAQRIVDHES